MNNPHQDEVSMTEEEPTCDFQVMCYKKGCSEPLCPFHPAPSTMLSVQGHSHFRPCYITIDSNMCVVGHKSGIRVYMNDRK